jgi:hypothetical protein
VIVFGREAAIEVPPYDDNVQMLERIESPISGDNTDISAAMRLAEASFPEDSARRAVVVSDGGENLGNAMEQAQSLVRAGVGIDVLPIRFRPRGRDHRRAGHGSQRPPPRPALRPQGGGHQHGRGEAG